MLLGSGGISDAVLEVGVNGGEGAEEQAVDVSQHGSAASRNAIGGKQAIDIGEGEVDTLGGLKILIILQQRAGQVTNFLCLLLRLGMGVTERSVRRRGGALATAAGRSAMLATSEVVGGDGVSG